MKTFAQFDRWRDLSGDAKVYEVFSHWHYNVDREVRLDEPVRALFVRYTGEPAVNNLRLFAHGLEDRPRAQAPVILTHEWTENGVRRTKQVKLDGPGECEIEASAEPVDESVEIAIPSIP